MPSGSGVRVERLDCRVSTFVPAHAVAPGVPSRVGLLDGSTARRGCRAHRRRGRWTDPLIGEGLSMAMRDARMVSEVLVGATGPSMRSSPIAVERRERSRRLRLGGQVITELRCTFTPEGSSSS